MGFAESIASSIFPKLEERGSETSHQEAITLSRERQWSSETESYASDESTSASSDISSPGKALVPREHPLRTSLPSTWYTSENFFALEARAIFSQVFPSEMCSDGRRGTA